MKKLVLIILVMLMFCCNAFAEENKTSDEAFKNEKKLSEYLKEYPNISGNINIFLEVKPNGKINSYKIINSDSEELSALLDNFFINKNKLIYPIKYRYNNKLYDININKQNGETKIDFISTNLVRNYEEEFYNKVNTKLNANLPVSNLANLNAPIVEIFISNLGKVNSITLIESSGSKEYDDELCKYILTLDFGPTPSIIPLKNNQISLIYTINPRSEKTQKDYNTYKAQIKKELASKYNTFLNKSYITQITVNKDGSIQDAELYYNYDLLDVPDYTENIKKIRLTPFNDKIKSESAEFFIVHDNNVPLNFSTYFNRNIAPSISKTVPTANSFRLKPMRFLIIMNKNGRINDIKVLESSTSEKFDNETMNAIKPYTFKPLTSSFSDEIAFDLTVYNLNEQLKKEYEKYRRVITSTTLKHIPDPYIKNLSTYHIIFVLRKDGSIKSYTLTNQFNKPIREKRVDNPLNKVKFPKFPANLNADEMTFCINLHDIANDSLKYGLHASNILLYYLLRQ